MRAARRCTPSRGTPSRAAHLAATQPAALLRSAPSRAAASASSRASHSQQRLTPPAPPAPNRLHAGRSEPQAAKRGARVGHSADCARRRTARTGLGHHIHNVILRFCGTQSLRRESGNRAGHSTDHHRCAPDSGTFLGFLFWFPILVSYFGFLFL